MGLWESLFGGRSEPDSLEAKLALEARINERVEQARRRRIREKAIDVVLELGNVSDSSRIAVKGILYPRICMEGYYKDTAIRITYSYHSSMQLGSRTTGDDDTRNTHQLVEQWKVRIYFNRNACYSEGGGERTDYTFDAFTGEQRRKELSGYFKYGRPNFPYGFFHGCLGDITTYLPGDWEAHLDQLYEKVHQVRKEKSAREKEEKLRAEQQKAHEELERRLSEIGDKKKHFGL